MSSQPCRLAMMLIGQCDHFVFAGLDVVILDRHRYISLSTDFSLPRSSSTSSSNHDDRN